MEKISSSGGREDIRLKDLKNITRITTEYGFARAYKRVSDLLYIYIKIKILYKNKKRVYTHTRADVW